MIFLRVNGEDVEVDVAADTPLLWVLRDYLNLTGTKYGCGIGQCGACTVHANGKPMKSCRLEVGQAASAELTTIEGLASDSLHPVQQAWISEQVPQCGYCQSGQIMAAVALLEEKSNPSDIDINDAMRNICRCGTYSRVRKAIHRVARERANL
ncbi:MAG: (2Fe-2S)-binding protein [Proteobacteria bacterium]|jgi:isoquinoline 1-oxidoreductase subunit alpha|nr:(2Fe-2S)-binding protein [Pseudomonadota bacterium]